uniref:ABC transmembrane type-1 domain-containing protein n=1 Tax=Anopheles maculatus TaxID=74869 RepID=A0A182SM25_9DIPT
MSIDDAGHRHGLSSPQYRNAARHADGLLSLYLADWLAAGYQVMIAADHGMNDDRSHGGVLPEERQIPLFVFGEAFSQNGANPRQSELCGTLCEEMKAKWLAALCLLPFIVLFGAFQIAPLVWIALNSFFSENSGWGWGNYVDVLTSPFYRQAFQFSLEISLWSSVYGLLIALVGSYSLRQLGPTRLHDFVMSFTNMTSNFAGVPLAFAFVILLGLNGCLTLLLRQCGLMDSFNLYSKSGLIVLYTYFQIPLGVLLLYPAFDALREDWRESAALLGAGPWHFWRHIGLP